MNFQEWKSNGNFFHYQNQHDIFYQEAGKGETLLLLHGFPTASWDWHKIWQPLSQRFHLLAPDFLGFGYSAKPINFAYSIHAQADMIEAFLKQKNLEKVHLFTHDYGDTVGQELLARALDRKGKGLQYGSVCLLNGGLFPETHKARPVQKILNSRMGFLFGRFLNKNSLRNSFNNIFGKNTPPTEKEIDEFYELFTNNGGKSILHKLIGYITNRKTHRNRWVNCLQKYPAPIRLINGGADPVSGTHMTKRYKELIPNPDVVIDENIGHYPQTEAPEWVLNNYFEFMLENVKPEGISEAV